MNDMTSQSENGTLANRTNQTNDPINQVKSSASQSTPIPPVSNISIGLYLTQTLPFASTPTRAYLQYASILFPIMEQLVQALKVAPVGVIPPITVNSTKRSYSSITATPIATVTC